MSTEASSRKLLDAIATKIGTLYDVKCSFGNQVTMNDILRAKDGLEGKDWRYKTYGGVQITKEPLPNFCDLATWTLLSDLNSQTNLRIHDGALPKTSDNRKFFAILPHNFATTANMDKIKHVAVKSGVALYASELLVKDEADEEEPSGPSSDGSP
ncbi:hypothetical protein DFS34DRAFT_708022 [Phlyctochytrium arcticum]|nr:hypothetical protein DFS34DRAFT_708022 [Phlyctochytrium arcticum]